MNDFDYENLQKKRIASSARHKVSGAKSRRCTLPHELLTPGQVRKLSGPVVGYDLRAPMSWEAFKAMPLDLQAEYITKLHQRFGVGPGQLSKMLGVSPAGFRAHLGRKGLDGLTGRYSRPRGDQLAAWRGFCGGTAPEESGEARDEGTAAAPGAPDERVSYMELSGSVRELLPVLTALSELGPLAMRATLFFSEEEKHDAHSKRDGALLEGALDAGPGEPGVHGDPGVPEGAERSR